MQPDHLSLLHSHDMWMVGVAALICLCGSAVTVQLVMRSRNLNGLQRRVQIGIAAVLGGATIWSTHFIGMLGYMPEAGLVHDTGLTILSFVVAIAGISLAFSLFDLRVRFLSYALPGLITGLTIAAMHFIGMQALSIGGAIVWDYGIAALAVGIGIVLGVIQFHRMLYPVTRLCWLGATLAMVVAVCGMHFTAMFAIRNLTTAVVVDPAQVVSNTTLTLIVSGVIALILLLGLGTTVIEASIDDDTNKKLFAAARSDLLTKLPNRLQMDAVFEELETKLTTDKDVRVAVLTINLDQFKQVNDLFGHGAGDEVIKIMADRLRGCLGETEFIARTSGDEFVAVKWDYQRSEEIRQFAHRLRAQLIEPISLPVGDCLVGASIGIALAPEDGIDMPLLLQKSGLAMYRAKGSVTQKIQSFDAEMEQRSKDAIALSQDLRLALQRGEFLLNYQMQNNLLTRDLVGFEVLLRWDHPTRGRVPPNIFIPIAEETGLICDIGLWVMRTACEEAASWATPCRIAVNVAPQQLVQPRFVEKVAEILTRSGLRPNYLEIEITEASIIDDQKYTFDVMHRLKAMGIRIAMDDFGTGYSSLSTLQAFPFDKIKIDRSFINNVHKNPQRAAIVRSTLLLGAALNVPILAEGAEQIEELDFLAQEKCAEVQGFFFGKPMPVEDARKLMNQQANQQSA